MPLTRDFKETVRARLKREPAFRKALLDEAIDCLRSGEASIGKKIMLRDLRDFPDEVNEARAKAKLTSRIVNLIRARRLTQVQAAALLKIDQPKLAALKKAEVSQFSLATLRRYLQFLSPQAAPPSLRTQGKERVSSSARTVVVPGAARPHTRRLSGG